MILSIVSVPIRRNIRAIRASSDRSPPELGLKWAATLGPGLALTGGAGPPLVGRLLKVDPQYFYAVPEVELSRLMNAAYSRLGLAGDERSKLNRITRQRGTREC